jgi:hypothetical protein
VSKPTALEPEAPQNLDAEESVLGAMMLSPAAVDKVREALDPAAFYRESHGKICQAAFDLGSRGEPVDAITLADELAKRGQLEDVGGRKRIHELAALVPATSNVGHYAKIVRECAARREEAALGRALVSASENGGLPAHPDVAERVRLVLDAPSDSSRLEPLWHQEALKREVPEQRYLVSELVQPASLGTIAGEPETFKSLIAIEIAFRVVAGGKVFSRFDVETTGPAAYIWQDDSEANELDRIQRYSAAHNMRDVPDLAWYLNRGLRLPEHLPDLAAEIRRYSFALVVLDSFYNFCELDLRGEEVLPILNGLKAIADQTGAAILVVDHAPKPSESTRGRRPNLTPYGSIFKAAAFRWGIYTAAASDGIHLSAGSNNASPAISKELLVFDSEAYELRLVDVQHVSEEEYEGRLLAYLDEHPGAVTKEILGAKLGNHDELRKALKRLVEAETLKMRSSGELGLSGTGNHYFPGNHALDEVVPLPGTTPDVQGSGKSASTEVVPPSLPRRGDDLGRDDPSDALSEVNA